MFTIEEIGVLHSALVNYEGPYKKGSKLNQDEINYQNRKHFIQAQLIERFEELLMEKKICPYMSHGRMGVELYQTSNCLADKCAMWRYDKDKLRCPECDSISDAKPYIDISTKQICHVCKVELISHTMGYCGLAGSKCLTP